MLVCDTCDKGYHTFCLQPFMKSVPTNGWKCKVSCLFLKKYHLYAFYIEQTNQILIQIYTVSPFKKELYRCIIDIQ